MILWHYEDSLDLDSNNFEKYEEHFIKRIKILFSVF